MNRLKPPLPQDSWQSMLALPSWRVMQPALLRVWVYLAVLSLAAGWIWRSAGVAPDIFTILDGAGLALWCSAVVLFPAWEKLQGRIVIVSSISPTLNRRRFAAAFRLLGSAVLLSFAPLGMLVAYNANLPIAHLLTLEMVNVNIPTA